MSERIVEAIADGEVLASYPINLRIFGREPTDAEFIEEAKAAHTEDGLSVALIDEWLIRTPGA